MECTYCRKQFQRQCLVRRHIEEEHSKESSRKISTIRPTEMQIVVSDIEVSKETSSSGNQPVAEPGASYSANSKVYSSNDELRRAREKTDPKRREHVFPQYVQEFSSNSSLQTQSLTYEEGRLIRCHRCPFHCKHHIALVCHVREEHMECTDCGTQFQSEDLLNSHIEDKHSKKSSLVSAIAPGYEIIRVKACTTDLCCQCCRKGCSSNDELRAHEATHWEPMEHVSPQSEEVFSEILTVKEHSLTYSDEIMSLALQSE